MSSSEAAVPPERSGEMRAPRDDAGVAIRFSHVCKEYRLYKNDRGRFLAGFLGHARNPWLAGARIAGNDLSFTIRRGESVAFIGRNGMGKSTTLKMICGLSLPDSGTIEVNGRVSALLELAAGFDFALTGRENIAMRGLVMGLGPDDMAAVERKTIEFAELGVYIDQPFYTYSSGMRSRLGFAFAVALEPEILIVDEALSVGDQAFQQKCGARIREIMANENVTVLLVTHSAAVARELCARGIVLDRGAKSFDGPIDDAVAHYESLMLNELPPHLRADVEKRRAKGRERNRLSS